MWAYFEVLLCSLTVVYYHDGNYSNLVRLPTHFAVSTVCFIKGKIN